MAAPPRRAALAFVFVTVLLHVLALGVIIPVLPRRVEDMMGGSAVDGAKLYGALGTVFALIFSPLFGSLSDRFGRRRVILLSNFGLGFDYLVMAVEDGWGLEWARREVMAKYMAGAVRVTVPPHVKEVNLPEAVEVQAK